MDAALPERVASAALLRTARLIMRGEVMVNAALFTEKEQ
jgi:2-methylaconitate cis-trans-isomerase PrpF